MKVAKWGMGASALVLATAVVVAQQPPAQNPNVQNPQQRPAQQPQFNQQPQQNQQRIQQNDQRIQQNDQRNVQNRQPGQATGLDADLANCIVLGNQEEIAISQWAMEHIRDQRVKQFAQQLVTDHQQALGKFRQFASYNGNLEVAGAGNADGDRITVQANRPVAGEERRDVTPQNDAANINPSDGRQLSDADRDRLAQGRPLPDQRMASSGDNTDRLFEVQKDAAAECLKLTKECLQKHQGEEFDQAFLGMQVGAHIGMLAKLKASEEAASPELRQAIDDATAKVKQHREHAEQLMKDLKTASNGNRPAGR